jgi:hypothetical protein
MRFPKQAAWCVGVSTVLVTGCASLKEGLRNPALVNMVQQNDNSQLIRVNSISQQELENPKGFIEYNADLLGTRTEFLDMDKTRHQLNDNVRTKLLFNIPEHTIYLKFLDKRQRSMEMPKDCEIQTAVFFCHYDDALPNTQRVFDQAKAQADSSKKRHMYAPHFKQTSPNIVKMYQQMALGISRTMSFDFKDSTVTFSSCAVKGPESKVLFQQHLALAKQAASFNTTPPAMKSAAKLENNH